MFGFDFGLENCIIQIKLGNQVVENKQLNAPTFIIQQQFSELCSQIMRDERPIKIELIKYDIIYDEFENRQKSIKNSIEYGNEAYKRAFPDEFAKE